MDSDDLQGLAEARGLQQRQEQISAIREINSAIEKQELAKSFEKQNQDQLYRIKHECDRISELINNADYENAYALILDCNDCFQEFAQEHFSLIEYKELYYAIEKFLRDIMSWAKEAIPSEIITQANKKNLIKKREQDQIRLELIKNRNSNKTLRFGLCLWGLILLAAGGYGLTCIEKDGSNALYSMLFTVVGFVFCIFGRMRLCFVLRLIGILYLAVGSYGFFKELDPLLSGSFLGFGFMACMLAHGFD